MKQLIVFLLVFGLSFSFKPKQKGDLITERKCYDTEQARDNAYRGRLNQLDKTSVLIMDNDAYESYYCEGYCVDYCYVIKYYGEI